MKPHFRLPASALFAAFALLPMVAGAQPAPVPLSTSATVVPRDGGPLPPGGITVTGRGSVSVPPDRLRVSVRLYPKNVTGQQLEKIAGDVAAAMRSGGIGDAKPVLPLLVDKI